MRFSPSSVEWPMPICTSCGEQNPDYATRCAQCGVSLGAQMRAKQDSIRGRNGSIVRIALWMGVLIILAIVLPPAYRTGNAAFQKYKFDAVNNRANKDCNGPITDSMQAYQKDEITKCLASNSELSKAQADYDAFTKASKP